MTAETACAARRQHRMADRAFPRGALTKPRHGGLGARRLGGAECLGRLRGAGITGSDRRGGLAERRLFGTKLQHLVQLLHDAAGLVEVVGIGGKLRARLFEGRDGLVQARRQIGAVELLFLRG